MVNETSDDKTLSGNALRQALIGTWELVSYSVEERDTACLVPAMGEAPRGRVIFTDDDWVAFNLEGEGRVPARNDLDRAALLQTLVSYIGRFRIEGNAWITQIETAWVPEWVGSEQKRFVTIENGFADVSTPWRYMPNWAPDKMTRSLIRFRRISPAGKAKVMPA
ncbi:lipocalin-like domain-containing protein [Asaia astilbis]|uniref:lipocalin-like domain-containing protein n=1 Tax=Asaia astilbis TaxID=610244 RepID=UPI0004710EE7|nr:lipocalin-like domain-containing protein [Asaia astilbis]